MNKKPFLVFLLFWAMLYGYDSRAQLAGGTYTINSAAATGGTNYASFTAAISAMSSGVTGPVVFNVVAGSGPYVEQVTIANITGTSAANTIKFNGNGATVQYNAAATYNGVLMMNGAKYVKFDSLTFKSLNATYGSGAILYNSCAFDSITRCTFDLTALTSTASTNFGIRISSTASGTSTTVSGATDSYLGGNTISGAVASGGVYYGFYFYGPNTNNVYDNNYVSNFYLYGISDSYASNVIYTKNILTRETKTSIAYCYGFQLTSASGASKVIGNIVRFLGGATNGTTYSYPFGIMSCNGTATVPILVSNNVMYGHTLSPTYGIRLSSSNYINVYHNTIDISHPVAYSGTMYGIYLTASANNNIKNNNVSITGGGTTTKYGIYYTTSTNTSDRNNVYVNSTQAGTQYFGYLGSAYATIAAFQAANPASDANSFSVNPLFVAPATGNFTPGALVITAAGENLLASVPTDVNGLPRSPAPTLGAFEKAATASNNASVSALNTPDGNLCAGVQPVNVTIRNSGINNITSVRVNWTLNSVAQTPFNYTGTLVPVTATGQNSAAIALGNATLIAGANTIKIWTSLPNNTTDGDPNDDTLSVTLTPATFTLTATLDTICGSGTSELTLSPSTGYNTGALQWQSSPDGVTWTNIANSDAPTYSATNLSAATRFRANILTGGTGCYSPVKTIQVRDVRIVTSTPATRCGVGSVTLTATGSTGSTINWYDAASGGTSLATGGTFTTPSISATTTYYATASTGGGSTATGVITPISTSGNSGFSSVGLAFNALSPFVLSSVDVYPMSTTSTSGTVTIALQNSTGTVLQSTTATVTVSAAGSLNTVPLNFNVPVGTAHRLVVAGVTGITNLIREITTGFTYPYTIPGVLSITSAYTGGVSSSYYYYLYNWKIATGCESARTPVVATIGTAPAITAAATSTTVCSGTLTTVSVTSANTAYNYSWSTGQTTASFAVTPTATTKYVVNALDPVTNCAAKDSVTVTVTAQTATITPATTQTICIGNTTTLSANTGTNLTYQWREQGNPIPGATNATYVVNATGNYTVEVTNTTTGCKGTSTGVTVNAVPAPVSAITPVGTVTVCTGDSLTIAGPTGTGYTYQWKNGAANATGAATGSVYYAKTAGTYTLVVSANGCSTTSSAVTVSLSPLPLPQITPSAAVAGCDSVNFSSSNTGVTYQWNYNGLPILGANRAEYAANVSGGYTVKVTDNVTGCSATSANVTATVNISPSGTITYSSPLSFCEGGSVVLNTIQSANTTYQWKRNGIDIPTATTAHHIADSTGLYTVVVMNTASGCGRASAPVQVQIYPKPTATIAYNAQANRLSTTQPFMQYQWRVNNQPIAGATQATHTPVQSGGYEVSVTDANGCQTLSSVIFVNNVGVVHTALGASLKIYPNPTNGLLYVKADEKVNITLSDVAGKPVFRGDSDQPVNLKEMADGWYLLQITDRAGRLIRAEKVTKLSN